MTPNGLNQIDRTNKPTELINKENMGGVCSENNTKADSEFQLSKGIAVSKGGRLGDRFLQEVNSLRRNPAAYANKISQLYSSQFAGDVHSPSKTNYIEGKHAFVEVENFLKMTPALPELLMQSGLVASSFDHAQFLAQTKLLSSVGRGGTQVADRLKNYGILQSDKIGECAIILPSNDPVRVLIELLADDGIVDRRNRYTLVDPRFKFFGCALVKDGQGEFYLVMDFAEEYRTDPSKATDDIILKAEIEANK